MLTTHANLFLAQPLLPQPFRLVRSLWPRPTDSTFTELTASTASASKCARERGCQKEEREHDSWRIPTSVKGAPPHLRAVIRKRQNSESAKRSRQRKRDETKELQSVFERQCERICALESKVAELVRLIKEEDEEIRQREIKEAGIRVDMNERMVWVHEGTEHQAQFVEKAVAELEWLTSGQGQRDCWTDALRVFEWKGM